MTSPLMERQAGLGCPVCLDPVAWTVCRVCGWSERLHGQDRDGAGEAASVSPEAVKASSGPLCFSLAWSALASSNERHKAGGGKARAHTKRYRESRDAIRLTATAHLKNQRTPLPAFPSGAVAIRLRFFPPNRRRVDETNRLKVLLDGLNGVVWTDDSQVADWHGTRMQPDKKKPRVEIEVCTVIKGAER